MQSEQLVTELTESLQQEADSFEVIVQVLTLPEQTYIYLNRPLHMFADCPELLARLKERITRDFPTLTSVTVVSRLLGEEEPDWQTEWTLQEPAIKFIEEEVSPEPEARTIPDINLSSFCFSRNRQLVEGDVERPSKLVAETLKTFHSWDKQRQIELLQFLKEWFADGGNTQGNLCPETRSLVKEMETNNELARSLKVWFSRYCFDADKTMAEITADNPPKDNSARHPKSSPKVDTPSRNQRNLQRSGTVSGKVSGSVAVASSQAFSAREIPAMVVVALLVGLFAWLLSGAVTAFGWMGLVLAVVSIVGGFAGAFRQDAIGGLCGLIMFAFWFILPMFLVWWFEVLGGAIGFITAMAMKVSAGSSEEILSGKSLRILVTALTVVVLVQGQSLLQVGGTGGDFTGIGEVATEYRAGGTITISGQSTNLQGAIATWSPENNVLTLALSTQPITTQVVEESRRGEISLDLRAFRNAPEPITAAVFVQIRFVNNRPEQYVMTVEGRLRRGNVTSGMTRQKMNRDMRGLRITSIAKEEGGRVNMSLRSALQGEFSFNAIVDTRIVALN